MNHARLSLPAVILTVAIMGCGGGEPAIEEDPGRAAEPVTADVVSVEVEGEPGAFTIRVGVSSPDTGCDQYADWWEVLSESGRLLYRRVLRHSHVDEQPFVRSGDPVDLDPDRMLWIRAHMNTGGYGGAVAHGSIAGGFFYMEQEADFAAQIAEEGPLPESCDG